MVPRKTDPFSLYSLSLSSVKYSGKESNSGCESIKSKAIEACHLETPEIDQSRPKKVLLFIREIDRTARGGRDVTGG